MKNKFIKASFLLACISFSSVLLASNLDIKSISLGASYSQIKNILPCVNFYETMTSSDLIYDYRTSCGGDTGFGREFYIRYNYEKRVISVANNIKFTISPDAEKIQQKLMDKYGKLFRK